MTRFLQDLFAKETHLLRVAGIYAEDQNQEKGQESHLAESGHFGDEELGHGVPLPLYATC